MHAANGYFLLSFVSRVWNHRDDQYGCQSVENRTRLVCEIIRGVKERWRGLHRGRLHERPGIRHPDAITIEEGVRLRSSTMPPGCRLHQRDGYGLRSGSHAVRSGLLDVPVSRRDMKQFLDRLTAKAFHLPAAAIKQAVSAR